MRRPAASRLPRLLHPAAWWLWGLGLATAASRTTNPFLLLLVVAVAAWVVLERREVGATDVFSAFLVVGLVAIGLRVLTAGLLGGGVTGRVVLVRLPEVPLPAWAAGVRLGGPVTLEGLLAAAYDGLRLAAILPAWRRERARQPAPAAALHARHAVRRGHCRRRGSHLRPADGEDAGRVRAARRLRGHSTRGLRDRAAGRAGDGGGAGPFAGPGRLDGVARVRSGRDRTDAPGGAPAQSRSAGLLGILVGLYGLLDASTPPLLGLPSGPGRRRARRPGPAHGRPARDPVALPARPVGPAGVAGRPPAACSGGGAGRRDTAGVGRHRPVQAPAGIPAVPLAAVLAIGCAALAGVLAPIPPQRALRTAGAGRTS